MRQFLIKTYTEDGYKPIPSVRLSDEEYGRGLQCFVPACVDIVPIDSKKKIIFLAPRKAKPMAGRWWWTGGKIMPHETKEETAIRSLERETGLTIPISRLKLEAVLDYRLKDRQQEPQNIGCHMLGYTYTVEFSQDEIARASANLEKNEFDENGSFSPFNRERLIKEKVFRSVIDLYDHIFPAAEKIKKKS